MLIWIVTIVWVTQAPLINRQLGLDVIGQTLERAQQPLGRGVVVGHVEGSPVSQYLSRVADRQFQGVRFFAQSRRSKAHDHAHATARMIYGNVGLAPGVTKVYCYASRHWIGEGCLQLGIPEAPKTIAGQVRVMNHSWISHALGTQEVLRRADYVIDQQDVVMVAGVNNGAGSAVPSLLASAYNAIAVGNWSGDSSGGYTRLDGIGRCKPDLVAPGGKTSYATPVVTAMVARLLEVADGMGASSDAHRAEVIKAVLMAGADKPQGDKRDEGRPLSDRYGAGRVRFDRSYYLITQGPILPGVVDSRYGWGFVNVLPGEQGRATWTVNIPENVEAAQVSIVAVWHRRIDGRTMRHPQTRYLWWNDTPRMADFDLALMGTDGQVAISASKIDNVEHVYVKKLAAGKYRIVLTRHDALPESWDVAVCWRIEK
jgi:hypothetical protein